MAYSRNGYTLSPEEEAAMRGGNSAASINTPAYGHTENGLYYLTNNNDSYVNAMNQEAQWAKEDLIRREGYAREDSAYQRLFTDLRKAGLNPALAVSGAESLTGSYGQSASTFKTSNYSANEKSQQTNSAAIFGALIAAIALVVAHAL